MKQVKPVKRVEFSLRAAERVALRWGHADSRAKTLAPGGKSRSAGLAGTVETLSISKDELVFTGAIEFGPRGLVLVRGEDRKKIPWSEINDVDSWFRGIIFYCDPTLYLPDRCFSSDEQRKEIVTLVAKKMGHIR